MRDILFRGKTKTGIWIEGFLFQTECDGVKEWCISMTPLSANDYSEILGDYGDVIPETVGQYTGLTDKNGTKIFEGDILKQYGFCYVVSFENGSYVAYETPYNESAILPRTDWENAVVVGNIHDNPELLKGGEG